MELPTNENDTFYSLRFADETESINLFKNGFKDQKVINVFDRVCPYSVFNCPTHKTSNWAKKRDRYPAKHTDWITYEFIENVMDLWFHNNTDNRELRNLNKTVQEIVFFVLYYVVFGIDGSTVDESMDLYHTYKKQLGSVNRQLITGIPPISPFYYFGKRKFLNHIKKKIKSSSNELLNESLITKLNNFDNIDELVGEVSSIFWGGTLSMAITITTAIFNLYKDPIQYDMVYYEPDRYAELAIKEALRICSGAPLITRRKDTASDETIAISPFIHQRKFGTDYNMANIPDSYDSYFSENPFFCPFGIPLDQGGRACAGQQLAITLMPKILHILLTKTIIKMDSSQQFNPELYCGSLKLDPTVYAYILPMYELDHDDNLDIFHKALLLLTLRQLKSNKKFSVHDIINEKKIVDYTTIKLFNKIKHVEVDECIFEEFDDLATMVVSKIPVQHNDAQWKDIDSAMKYINKKFGFNLAKDQRTSLHYNIALEDEEKRDVDYLIQLLDSGILSHLCTRHRYNDTNKIVVDLTHMYKYEVYDELLPYGAKLVVDDTSIMIQLPFKVKIVAGQVTQIRNKKSIYYPKSRNWQMAYNVFVSSVMAYVTIIDHALYTHFMVSGHTSSEFIKHSELYDFFKPFMFKVFEVNQNALQILVNKGGIVDRIFSFTNSGLTKFMEDHMVKFSMDKWVTNILENKTTAVGRDIIKYYDVFYKLCKQEFPLLTDKYRRRYAGFILNATVWHEYVGNMGRYVMRPKLFRTKVYKSYPNSYLETQQGTIQNVHLVLLTSVVTMPKIGSDLWKVNNNKAWHTLQKDINNLELECEFLKPQYVECSVSL